MSKRRFSVRAHPAGLLLIFAAFLFGSSHIALAAALSLAAHEGAHMLAMALCGVKRCTVELTPFGGVADAEGFEALPPNRQAVCALSGVLASLTVGLSCLRFAPVTPFWHALWRVNLSLALVNCLPVWPLDGARAVMALALRFGFAPFALRVMRALACALSLALAALGLYGAFIGRLNLSLLIIGPYLGYAAREGALSDGVRLMRRMEASRGRLNEGEIAPARVLVSKGKPNLLHTARILKRMPWGTALVMHITEPDGRIIETLGEEELLSGMFGREDDNSPRKE